MILSEELEERMKVQIEKISPIERKIFFEIPNDVVSQEVESTYRALNRNVKLKGFRPGKAPRSILQRYYKSQVEEEVVSKLIKDSYGKAVEEYHLTPVAAPTVLDHTFEADKDFKYTVTVEVKPEVTVEGYLGLEVEKAAVSVSEEEVQARLKDLQETHAQLKPLETKRSIQERDFVIIDFEGSQSGKPLEGWKVEDHLVEVGSKTLVGDLDRQLIGLSQNEEKDTSLTLPETHSKKELAGQKIDVHIKVKEIKEKILPPLDDEFAKDVGNFNTLADLKARLRQTIEEEKQAQANRAAKEKLLRTLVEKHSFPIPKSMVERHVQNLIARAELRLARQGMKLEDASLDRQKLHDSFLPTAEKEARGSLILEKIAEMEKVSVSEAELQGRLEKMAVQLNQRVEAVKSYYQREGLLEDLRAQILEEKTLDFVLSQSKINERPGNPAETSLSAHPEEKK
jgi:trigger factor